MHNPLPSADSAPTKAERMRAFIEGLVAVLDPDFPSAIAADNLAPSIDDESRSYGTEHGARPDFVAQDDAAWRG